MYNWCGTSNLYYPKSSEALVKDIKTFFKIYFGVKVSDLIICHSILILTSLFSLQVSFLVTQNLKTKQAKFAKLFRKSGIQ